LPSTSGPQYKVWAGEHLTSFREEQGLTRTGLGARIGRSPDAIGLYERGVAPPISVMCALACTLGIEPSDLLRPATDAELIEAGIEQVVVTTVTPTPSFRRHFRRRLVRLPAP
jgi:transcriptional regulator with XRE-family HTH domain